MKRIPVKDLKVGDFLANVGPVTEIERDVFKDGTIIVITKGITRGNNGRFYWPGDQEVAVETGMYLTRIERQKR